MIILHYFLGFPPYRSGGLTRYVMDLMESQYVEGNRVAGLWPGQMGILDRKVRIRECRPVQGILSYELVNPLPVPLDEGIADPSAFMQSCDPSVYEHFLETLNPDVIHIHTWMGIHREFVEAAAHLKIRMVFTTHDYYGICPKVTLYHRGQACEDDHGCEDCVGCNASALSMKKVMILQSPMYRWMKDMPWMRRLRIQHRADFFGKDEETADFVPKASSGDYRELREYYLNMLKLVDLIHYNSTITKNIYEKYLSHPHAKVLSITHRGIQDHRGELTWTPSGRLRITLLAPAKPSKGFLVLEQALNELWQEGKRDFILNVYSAVPRIQPYMQVYEDGFDHSMLPHIMEESDLVVAPSLWYETFGFTVLEAISFGVPVIVSDHVGAMDIIGAGGRIVRAGDVKDLKSAICEMDMPKLQSLREAIRRDADIMVWKDLVESTCRFYEDATGQ